MNDEALEEIWEIRRRIFDECDGDRRRVFERYRRAQDSYARQGGRIIGKPGVNVDASAASSVVREEPPAAE